MLGLTYVSLMRKLCLCDYIDLHRFCLRINNILRLYRFYYSVSLFSGIYGVVYHTIDCDLFTREFLESQGIDVGDKEEPPVDPYTELRSNQQKTPVCVTRIPDDARRRFLEYDKMVLSFTATWNDDNYRIMYFLTDNTIAIREIQKQNSGKDPVAMLLKKMKVPKDWKNLPSNYPAVYMEYSDPEISEYYTPKDFIVSLFAVSRVTESLCSSFRIYTCSLLIVDWWYGFYIQPAILSTRLRSFYTKILHRYVGNKSTRRNSNTVERNEVVVGI